MEVGDVLLDAVAPILFGFQSSLGNASLLYFQLLYLLTEFVDLAVLCNSS